MTALQNTRLGIWLMIATTVVFAAQDGISRHLGSHYPVTMVVMIRFWFFGLFAMVLAARSEGGLKAAAKSAFPWVQLARGVILVAEIAVMLVAFVRLGLIEAHAVFTCYPLWSRRSPARSWARRWAGGAGRRSSSASSAS